MSLKEFDVLGAKTIRGCASSLNLKGCTEPNCLKCKGKDCNKGLVPAKRPLCHHCDSDTNDECGKEIAENGAKPTVCLNFNFRELCYTSVSKSKKIQFDYTQDFRTD